MFIKNYVPLFLVFLLFSCQSQTINDFLPSTKKDSESPINEVQNYYNSNIIKDVESKSLGSVSNGSLVNGYLFPFSGTNYLYFDTTSYLNERAYTNSKVLNTVIESYKELESGSSIYYRLMECSNKCGGKMFPHRTHQNGLSIDFMMPLLKNGVSYTKLDDLGVDHYLLEFNNMGELKRDTSIKIDFNEIAKHILSLESKARKNKLRIKKIIIKISYKKELFNTEYGKLLKRSGIYVVRSLSPLIDSLHDEHYHIDFEKI